MNPTPATAPPAPATPAPKLAPTPPLPEPAFTPPQTFPADINMEWDPLLQELLQGHLGLEMDMDFQGPLEYTYPVLLFSSGTNVDRCCRCLSGVQ